MYFKGWDEHFVYVNTKNIFLGQENARRGLLK